MELLKERIRKDGVVKEGNVDVYKRQGIYAIRARDDRSCTSVIEYWRLDEAVSNCSGSFGSGDLDHSIFRYFL